MAGWPLPFPDAATKIELKVETTVTTKDVSESKMESVAAGLDRCGLEFERPLPAFKKYVPPSRSFNWNADAEGIRADPRKAA